MTDPEVRDLLSLAAGSPDPGPLLPLVRREAARVRRRRRVTAAVAAVLGVCVIGGGTAVAIHGNRTSGSTLAQTSPAPTPTPTQASVASSLPGATVATSAAKEASLVPSPGESFAASNPTGTGPCAPGQLRAGRATQIHVLAGEDGVDLPLQAKTPCVLTITGLDIAPDAAVPVTRTTAPKLQILPDGVVHLVLTGESDGSCGAIPDARHVVVRVGGQVLTTLPLPTLGLCASITATLQRDPATGEQPAVAATSTG